MRMSTATVDAGHSIGRPVEAHERRRSPPSAAQGGDGSMRMSTATVDAGRHVASAAARRPRAAGMPQSIFSSAARIPKQRGAHALPPTPR
jgi:hypothetical protein